MVRAEYDLTVSLASNKKSVQVQLGPRTYSLSLSKAFSIAHEFIRRKQYKAASQVCRALVQSRHLGPRAVIMLARCKAGLNSYSSCNKLLRTLFTAEDSPVAERLHTAFVYHHLGLRADAIRELTQVAHDRPDLPTVCLLLGDLYAAAGRKDRAMHCWQLAVQRDHHGGAVAHEARRGLSTLGRKAQSKRSPDR